MTCPGDPAGADNAPSLPQQSEEALALVRSRLGRRIAFYRRLVELTASAKAALLLSQAIYWTRHGRDIAKNGGWFYKTTDQWQRETGLTAREQESARRILRDLGVLQEKRTGIPARLYLRLDLEQLTALLSAEPMTPVDWSDGASVARQLGSAWPYHRVLAEAAGGVNAGLMLSRALFIAGGESRQQSGAWLCRPACLWVEEIGLTRREQENARRALLRLQLWEEALVGIPSRVFVRVRLAALLQRLAECAAAVDRDAAPGCGNPAVQFARNGTTRMWESHNQVSTKVPSRFQQNRHHSYDKNAKVLIQGSTSTAVQPPLQGVALANCGTTSPSGGGDWVFPEGLSREEQSAAVALAGRCPGEAQALLDELAARMRAGGVQTSPIAYLRGMVTRAEAGRFVPALAEQVAAARHQEVVSKAEAQGEKSGQRAVAGAADPEREARMAQQRARLHEILNAIRKRRPSRGIS